MIAHSPRRIALAAAVWAGATAVACDGPDGVGAAAVLARVRPATGTWVFHDSGAVLGAGILPARIWSAGYGASPLRMVLLAGRDDRGHAVFPGVTDTLRGQGDTSGYEFTGALPGGERLELRYRVTGDSAIGAVEYAPAPAGAATSPLIGMRIPFDMTTATDTDAPLLIDSVPRVLVRIDDDSPTDPAFVHHLAERGLTAELAIPTRKVGLDGRPGWDSLRAWSAAGFGMAAHSRYHTSATDSELGYMVEFLGSMADMEAHGLRTTVFVQPGVWTGSIDFDSTAKLRNWRGALAWTFASVFEGYVYRPTQTAPFADSIAIGIGHFTLSDGITRQGILNSWAKAQQRCSATVYLVHTFRLASPDSLDWFLDTLAAARREGRIRVERTSYALFAGGRPASPACP